MKEGSVTVFLGLCLSMIMSLFFSMTEVTRYFALTQESKSLFYSATQSAFGEYNRPLWENYGILAIDTDYCKASKEDGVCDAVRYYLSDGYQAKNIIQEASVDFLKLYTEDVSKDSCIYLTDEAGAALIKEAARCMEGELASSVISEIQKNCENISEDSKNDVDLSTILENASDSLDQTQVEQPPEENEEDSSDEGKPKQKTPKGNDDAKNLIQATREFIATGVLAQVISVDSISETVYTTPSPVSERLLNTGDGSPGSVNAFERALFQYYLTQHFSNYTNHAHEGGMSYELEYILCGKKSDRENLAGTVERLLAIREVENLISLHQDPNKVAEAKALAATATAVCLHPELEEIVSYGIMIAWAYLESVLDVRLLLSGGKVSFIKTPGEWTSQLAALPTYFNTSVKANQCASGINYEQYLLGLFTVERQEKLTYRSMDLMEETLHQIEHYENVCMDHMLVETCFYGDLKGNSLFLNFVPLYESDGSGYDFSYERTVSYL